MKDIVITIGREYGSGGKYIGEKVSKKLNIPFYDKELINKTYEKSGCNYSKLKEYDEVKRNYLIKILNLMNTGNNEEAFNDNTYQTLVQNTIKELADSGSCVILGRNSNNILKDHKNAIHFFIYSNDLEFKLKRKMKIENISHEEALNRLKQVDKMREKYYESFSKNSTWGSTKGYDYCLDSSILGVDGTVDLIVDICTRFNNR